VTLPQAAAAAAALPLQQNASVELPPTLAPPLAVRRSTRPKLAVRRDNVSAALVPVLKRLNELLRHHYAAPFATPVDPSINPSYYHGPRAVEDPVDLGTIKKNVEAGKYTSEVHVKTDVDRVWANCRQYNGRESELARMAEKLEEVFDEKMATIPQEVEAAEAAARRKDDQRKARREHALSMKMQDLQRQMAEMKQLLEMQRQCIVEPSPAAPPTAAALPAGALPAAGNKRPRGATPPIDLSHDMTHEEKARLTAAIQKLSSDRLPGVVAIIRKSTPSLGNGTDEIEVDFNALDRKTLWELHRFVNARHKKRPSKKQAHHTTVSRMAAVELAKAQTEERIAYLQQSLQSKRGGGTDDFGGNDFGSESDVDALSDSD